MTRRKLSIEQEVILGDVTRYQRELKEMKRSLKLQLEIELRRRLESQQRLVDDAVVKAVKADIPQVRIYQDGLGTKNPYSLKEALERVGQGDGKMYGPGHPFFAWEDQSRGIVRVRYPDFPTTSKDEAYPEELVGTVAVEFGQVTVLEDQSDRETEYGTIPGSLRWEVERSPSEEDGAKFPHMAGLIREWVERNR